MRSGSWGWATAPLLALPLFAGAAAAQQAVPAAADSLAVLVEAWEEGALTQAELEDWAEPASRHRDGEVTLSARCRPERRSLRLAVAAGAARGRLRWRRDGWFSVIETVYLD